VRYRATLDITHHVAHPESVFETPVAQLPPEVLTYLYPSRYCQSDCLTAQAMALFGTLPQGYRRVIAVATGCEPGDASSPTPATP
jgi:hypothetical protein